MSRQPPLPPGPPPNDFYRPGPSRYDNNYPPPPGTNGRNNSTFQFQANMSHVARPPPPPPPPPQGVSSNGSYRDQTVRYNREPNYSMQDSYRPSQTDFTFRQDAPRSIIENSRQQQDYRQPIQRSRNNVSDRRDGYNQRDGHHQAPSRGRGGYRGRGGFPRRAAERPMLQTKREPTPELMKGMDSNENETVKFRSPDDLSDSDEVDMDLSSNEVDASHGGENSEQPRKKQARTASYKAAEGDSIPRWSNPDPYTALPPPDESQGPKRDILKMIRKSKVESNSKAVPKSEAVTDDFISFDFGDQDDEDDQPNISLRRGESSQDAYSGNGMPGVPTGPSGQQSSSVSFSHRESLHESSTAARAPISSVSEAQKAGKMIFEFENPSDTALGNRKRTIDDEIKDDRWREGHSQQGGQRQVQVRRVRNSNQKSSAPVAGRLTSQWSYRNNATQPTPSPWCTVDHSRTTNMGLWLHKEIIDFYEHVKPRSFEEQIRTMLIEKLRRVVKQQWHGADIHSFGSFPAGLYLPTADMDLVLLSSEFARGGYPQFNSKRALWRFRDFIQHNRLAVTDSIEVIASAKVPIVKYVDAETGLKVDISFENMTGIVAIDTFKNWKKDFPAMPIIVTLLKQFLAMRGLNEPANGGIGGFSVTCLVVSLLQNLPSVQSGNLIPEHHLNEILMEFFNLYGNDFDSSRTAIQFNPPGYIQKSLSNQVYRQTNISRLSIIDPNNPDNDIAGGSKNTEAILDSFSQAYNALSKRMGDLHHLELDERHGQSILEVILGGNYSSFKDQRQRLARLQEQLSYHSR